MSTLVGSITASCGHKLAQDEDSVPVRYQDYTCDAIDGYSHAVAYAEFCPKCAAEWKARGDLIESDEEEEAWFAADPKRHRP